MLHTSFKRKPLFNHEFGEIFEITDAIIDETITEVINRQVEEFIKEFDGEPLLGGGVLKCSSAWDINNGLCDDFADKLEIKFPDGYVLSSDMFVNYEAVELWGKKDVIQTKSKNGGGWSKKMIKMYGKPPVKDIKLVEDLPNHSWFFYEDKHYDAECPDGVDTPWELPIFKRLFIHLNEEIFVNSK